MSGLPSFDLVVATVDRTDTLGALLDSLAAQTYSEFRVVVVDQNDDDRLTSALAGRPFPVERARSPRGLSRARNVGLAHASADVVGFPDDDCTYGPDLLARVAHRLAADPSLDGLTGLLRDATGAASDRWPGHETRLDRSTVWHGGSSATLFLRRPLLERVGPFDERLGLGSGTPWSSGEDTELLVRAIDAGARLVFDPALAVVHPLAPVDAARLVERGRRDGGGLGYVLAKHRYPASTVARMLVRPAGGAISSFVRGDRTRAAFHRATLAGRLAGYRAGRAARSSSNSA